MMLCGYLFPRVQRCMNTNRKFQRFRPSTRFLGQLSFWANYLHSACDPFIYAFKHPEYQDTLKDIARKFKIAITSTFCCCMSKDANEEETKEKR